MSMGGPMNQQIRAYKSPGRGSAAHHLEQGITEKSRHEALNPMVFWCSQRYTVLVHFSDVYNWQIALLL